MELTRRNTLTLGGATLIVTLAPMTRSFASDKTSNALNAFSNGAAIGDGGIELVTPEIAENGNTVQITFSAPNAKRIMLLADGNPNPDVATFKFAPLATPSATTRIRLGGTQNVVAVAEMTDGTYTKVAKTVKVTIGGCGG